MKKKLANFIKEKNSKKFLFTAGPSSLTAENILGLGPCFGRNDSQYLKVELYRGTTKNIVNAIYQWDSFLTKYS